MGDVLQWMMPLMVLVVFHVNLRIVSGARLSINAPVNPVRLDAMLSIFCKIQDLDEETHDVAISKEDPDGKNYKVLSMGKTIQDKDDNRLFLAMRRLSDGTKVFFLSIINVKRKDEGIYKCKLLSKNPLGELEAHPVRIIVTYIPEQNPECSSSIQLDNLMAGDILKWNCSSEEGFPRVSLTWLRSNTGTVLRSANIKRKGYVVSELNHRLSERDDQAMFICKLESTAFTDMPTKACHIGPVSVKINPYYTGAPSDNSAIIEDDRDNTKVGFPTPGSTVNINNNNNAPECKEYCSTLSTPVLYWIIATISAGILAIIFLIIGITISVKLCHLSSSRLQTTKVIMPPQQRRYPQCDETYTELDCKTDDGNRVYMMLDRSQIPEMQPLNPNLDREGNYTRTPTATKEIHLPTQYV